MVAKEAIVAAEKKTPLVNTAVKEEEQIRVSREDKKMDEHDSGGQAAPMPDDEGNAPPLPEKVSTFFVGFVISTQFSSYKVGLLSLALFVVSLIRRKLSNLSMSDSRKSFDFLLL